jgi:succinate dehydrogenase / fumarate reductase iron-sulfur subunit
MKVQLKIRRFDPETDGKSWWGTYEVEAEPTDRVLDALHYVKDYIDGTLAFRRSCGHGICGSDSRAKC